MEWKNERVWESDEKYFGVNFIRVYLINDEHISFRTRKRELFGFCVRMSFHDFFLTSVFLILKTRKIFILLVYIRCLTLSTTVTVKMLSIFKNLLLIRNSRNIQIRCSLHNLYDISNFYTPALDVDSDINSTDAVRNLFVLFVVYVSVSVDGKSQMIFLCSFMCVPWVGWENTEKGFDE